MKQKLALFDLDGTLLPFDSDHAWGEFTTGIGWTDAGEFKRRNDEFFEAYQRGALDIHDYIYFATSAMRERGRSATDAAQNRFMQQVVAPSMHDVAKRLVRTHQDAGDLVALVTATNELVTRPIATAFGINDLLAVELERDDGGWITGQIAGTPSFREGKITRVAQWLEARGLGWSDVETTFYSDSGNDLPLLERVDHPVATNPDDALRALAVQRGWRVLDLFEEVE